LENKRLAALKAMLAFEPEARAGADLEDLMRG